MIDSSALLDLVPDTSGAEPPIEKYAIVRRFHELRCPRLLMWELGNALYGPRKQFGWLADRRESVLQELLSDVVLEDLRQPFTMEVGKIAERHVISFYDAAYIELAIRLGAILVTHDEKMRKAAKVELGERRTLRWAEVEGVN